MRGPGPTAVCAAIAAAALGGASPAAALTFEVDSLGDGVDATPADDICATAGGRCTLRAAIDAANQAPGNDEIKVPRGTIELKRPPAPGGANSEGDLDPTEAVEIDGRGPSKSVIRQTVKDGVLNNDAPFAGFSEPGLQLSDVTITGGRVGGPGESGGGGIQNNAFALLANVVIRDNVARSDADDDVPAGGVLSTGTMALSNTTVRDNVARGVGDTQAVGGGIMVADGGLTLQDGSKVVGNSAVIRDPEPGAVANGGGVVLRNPGGEPQDAMMVFDSTIAGNTASGAPIATGGGINAGVNATIDMTRSTVSGNRSRMGGGLYTIQSLVNISNSTLSGNAATRDAGAAIFQQSEAGDVDLTSVTVAQNHASDGHFAIESGEQALVGSVTLFASIVANPGPECGGEAGAVSSSGKNVVGDLTCGFNPGLGMDIEAGPRLKPLGDYGGPTRTHALKGSSPAIDHVTGCAPGVDQRGVSRPQGAHCDAGSFERAATP
jgi:hypothetical protein